MNAAEFLFADVQPPAKTAGHDLRAQRLHAQDLHAQDLHARDLLHPHDARHQND
jgi:hypothetical protein